ncbi:MAG: FG-GAP-like repeat-containing protein [Pseudomonadota bacterium]
MKRTIISIWLLALIVSAPNLVSADESVKVAIVPFTVHAPSELHYVGDGIFDMLASRIAWDRRVVVLDRETVSALSEKHKDLMDEDAARQLGLELQADYVLTGSLTVLGNTSSMDVHMVPVKPDLSGISFHAQAGSLDEIIPKVDELAQDINAKLLGRTIAKDAGKAPEGRITASSHPQKILLQDKNQATGEPDRKFIQKSKDRKDDFWKSQDLPLVMRGLEVSDLDNDGREEIAIITQTDIWVFKHGGERLAEFKQIKGEATYNLLSLDAGDMNGNGIPEIYVSNLTSGTPDSFVLEWNGSDFVRIAEHMPWHLSLVTLDGRTRTALCQEKGTDAPFKPEVYTLQWKNRRIEIGAPVSLPAGANVFNFVRADVDRDGPLETAMIDDAGRLRIYSASGKLLGKSEERYGQGLGFFTTNPARSPNEPEERYYIPARMSLADSDKDGSMEIIINKNLSGSAKVFRNLKEYSNSLIYSLGWDGTGLSENWKTRELSGAICDYRMTGPDDKGGHELFLGIVLETGIPPFSSGKSAIISYKLEERDTTVPK